MKTADYYGLTEERQEYIRDVFLAIENAALGADELAQANVMDQVFPRQTQPNAKDSEKITSVLAQGSGNAQAQQLNEITEQQKFSSGFKGAETILARRNEALMSPKSPGGLG